MVKRKVLGFYKIIIVSFLHLFYLQKKLNVAWSFADNKGVMLTAASEYFNLLLTITHHKEIANFADDSSANEFTSIVWRLRIAKLKSPNIMTGL